MSTSWHVTERLTSLYAFLSLTGVELCQQNLQQPGRTRASAAVLLLEVLAPVKGKLHATYEELQPRPTTEGNIVLR